MEYKILTRTLISDLEDIVKELILQGWEPIGGTSVVCVKNNIRTNSKNGIYDIQPSQFKITQAMIKRVPKELN